MSTVPTHSMFIDGQSVPGASGRYIDVYNPATSAKVGRIAIATEEELDAAVSSSYEAFKEWRDIPASRRAKLMMDFINAVRDRKEEVAALLSQEGFKPYLQALGEVNGFCAVMEFYAQEARRITGMVLQSDAPDKFVYVLRTPHGVVACIPPWNDPLHLWSRMMGPALAAGCTVVVKPSSDTPLATSMVARIAFNAGLPAGVVNMVAGPGGTVGDALARHPLVSHVSLTGSLPAGISIMNAASETMKRVTLELGGQCPCIVWDDADLDKAVDALTFQAFRSAGQVCNRVNRVYAHQAIYGELVERVGTLASRILVGEGTKDGPVVDIGPLINERQLNWVDSQVKDAAGKGARVVTGGQRLSGPEYDNGFFYAPTVLADCNHEMEVMHEETFGPVLAFMEIGDDLMQAFDYANDSWNGLSAYFFSADQRNCYLAARYMDAGSVWINDIHGSMLQAPYGGMKQSGVGREQGSIAVDEYLEWKTVYQEMSYETRGERLCVRHEDR